MKQHFYIRGQPVAKGRPRMSLNGHAYTPEKTRQAENNVKLAAFNQGIRKVEGPVVLECNFYFQIPKSWSKKARKAAEEGLVLPASKPDIDNCIKLIQDALNEIAYVDDKQIIGIVARKYYAVEPYTFVQIQEVQ